MQLPSHLMFAIHSSIDLSSKGCHMGMRRISSGGASGPVEESGAAKPGGWLLLTNGQLDIVFPHVFLHFPLNLEPLIPIFAH